MPIELDGRADEAIWPNAPRIDAFSEFQPVEDGAPAVSTEARIVYGDKALYLHIRAFDPPRAPPTTTSASCHTPAIRADSM